MDMAGYPEPRKWTPRRKEKYAGDVTNIIARSSWEIRFMNWCDTNPSVVEWSSEEIKIPYICATDNKPHTYWVDFKIRVRVKDGTLKTYLVEVKPYSQTLPPSAPKRKTKQYLNEVLRWGKNQSKWKYAKDYCECRKWEFKIITERELGIG